jgi:tripartite-type tricarboxylate transporter receptor subunit TctC
MPFVRHPSNIGTAYFGAVPQLVEPIKAGKLRVLGVTTATRLQSTPDVPTCGRFRAWLCGKRPPTFVNKLNQEIKASLADPKLKQILKARARASLRAAVDDHVDTTSADRVGRGFQRGWPRNL